MNHLTILKQATRGVESIKGHTLDVLDIKKPDTLDSDYAMHLSKTVSKISPFVGNMIEFLIVERLNEMDWKNRGKWVRQDPGFPDVVFNSPLDPAPGMEIKTWFPIATEITARFKDSVLHFGKDQTKIVVVAWLPEFLIYGKPKIMDVWIGSAKNIAEARNAHYHKPPGYLVIEPGDTSSRTANLQQTNTNGYKFQGSDAALKKAEATVKGWGRNGAAFSPLPRYQNKIRQLMGAHRYYRPDSNYAKIDRIMHPGLEEFKARVLATKIGDKTILEWRKQGGLPKE